MARHHIEHGSGLTSNLRARLTELAALPPVLDTPYLTVCVDWSVDGENPGATVQTEGKASQRRTGHGGEGGVTRRAGRIEIAHELKKIVEAAGIRGDVRDSLAADSEAILSYLDNDLDGSTKGVFIVANTGAGVFEAVSFGVPAPTGAVTGPTPALSPLARIVEDYPPYLVFLGDQKDASLTVVTRHRPAGNLTMKGSKYPKHQKQGGSQRRFQERAQNRIDQFVKDAAAEAESLIAQYGIDMVIVAGDEVFVSALKAGIGQKLLDAIVAHVNLDIRATDQQILDATMPIIDQAERDRELADARKLASEIGEADKGAGDIIPVLKALVAGQASDLIFNEDFQAVGWADFSLDLYGPGEVPAEHPAGGDAASLVAIDLDEEMVRLALRGGAEIEIIETQPPVAQGHVPKAGDPLPRTEAAAILDQFGGVGALLRYA